MINADDQNFDTEVIQYEGLSVVDFWADWCAPCKNLLPIMQRVDNHFGSDAKVIKVNVDEAPIIASKAGVISLPTVIAYQNGREVSRKTGFHAESLMREWIEGIINA